jgi:hypothetical protein
VNCQVTNCTWTANLLDANAYPAQLSFANAITSGVRLFQHNVTPEGQGLLQLGGTQGLLIDNCYIGSFLFALNTQPQWNNLQNCFLYQSTDYGGSDTTETNGPITNNFLLMSTNALSYVLIASDSGDCTISGNVIQSAETSGDWGYSIIATGEEGSGAHTLTVSFNIVLPAFGGGFTGCLVTNFNNASLGFNVGLNVLHNTVFYGPSTGITPIGTPAFVAGMTADGTPLTMRADEISTFKSNLIARTGAAPGGGTIDVAAVQAFYNKNPVNDAMRASNCDYNAYTALDTTPSGWWTGGGSGDNISGSGGEINTVYNSPMTLASGAPGSHDVKLGQVSSLSTAGPRFVDPTRGLLQWDSVMGGPGTLAHALQSLKAQYDPTNPNYIAGYTNAALVAWIKAGWRPQNGLLENASYPGDPSTVDAAGNPWPGGGPGIGAMAAQLAGSAVLTRTERADIPTGSGSLRVPTALSFTDRNDSPSIFGSIPTDPSLSGIEQHDAGSMLGVSQTAAFLDYLGISDRFIASATAASGPTVGEYTFDPYAATFIGDSVHRDWTPIPIGSRTTILIEAVGNAAAVFAADDLLSAQFYPYGSPAVVFQPSTAWYTAGGEQSGWEQRQFAAAISLAQASLLVPSVRYVLDCYRAPASDPANVDLVASFTFIAKSPWQP